MSEAQVLIDQLNTLSYVGIWGVSFIANVIVPFPEEVILLALGYLIGTGKVDVVILIPLVISGLLASDIIMFFLSRKGNKLVTFFYNKFFASRIEKRREWLESHIGKVIFFSRFLVQLRFIGPFMAGQSQISWRKFVLYDLLALIVYVPLFIFLGWYFHTKINLIIDGIGTAKNIILTVVAMALAFSLSKLMYRAIFKKNKEVAKQI